MANKIILNKSQFFRIFGMNEEFMGYFKDGDNPVGGTHETNVDGILIGQNIADSEPFSSPKFDKSVTRRHNMMGVAVDRHSPIISMAENKKKISEENSSLKNLNIYAKVSYDDPNVPSEEMLGSENALEMQRLRAQKSGNLKKAKAIDTALHQRRDPININKKFRSQVLGQENVYQKKGGRKINKGTAHTKK